MASLIPVKSPKIDFKLLFGGMYMTCMTLSNDSKGSVVIDDRGGRFELLWNTGKTAHTVAEAVDTICKQQPSRILQTSDR